MERSIHCISYIEAIYFVYMFIFFKTRYSIHHPFEKDITNLYDFIKHPIGSYRYENKVCVLGKIVSILFSIWLLLRHCLDVSHKKTINSILVSSIGIGCLLMNLNAFIYYLPILLLELCYMSDTLI